MLKPTFEKGSILKQNMLESLRDYPRSLWNLLYAGYGNGIIEGFDVTVLNDDRIKIMPGIVKNEGVLYFSNVEQIIEQKYENNYVYLEVIQKDSADGVVYSVEIYQYDSPQIEKIELFRYTRNAKLSMLQGCQDLFNPPINRINRMYSQYSYRGGYGLCPDYFKFYAADVLCSSNAKMEDIAFAYQCLNGLRDIDAVSTYFCNDGSNSKVIEAMKEKLSLMNRKVQSVQIEPEKSQGPRKMIVS